MSVFEEAVRRFWGNVSVAGGDECWIYNGPGVVIPSGHVRVAFMGSKVYAHRLGYRLMYGEWPEPMCLHACDVPACVRGDHLAAGDSDANVMQRELRQRRTPFLKRGPENPLSKLTKEDVSFLIEAREAGIPARTLAADLSVSVSTVYTALRRANAERSIAA